MSHSVSTAIRLDLYSLIVKIGVFDLLVDCSELDCSTQSFVQEFIAAFYLVGADCAFEHLTADIYWRKRPILVALCQSSLETTETLMEFSDLFQHLLSLGQKSRFA